MKYIHFPFLKIQSVKIENDSLIITKRDSERIVLITSIRELKTQPWWSWFIYTEDISLLLKSGEEVILYNYKKEDSDNLVKSILRKNPKIITRDFSLMDQGYIPVRPTINGIPVPDIFLPKWAPIIILSTLIVIFLLFLKYMISIDQ